MSRHRSPQYTYGPRRWIVVHVRRHVPFALYTAGTVAAMVWFTARIIEIL